MRIATVQDGLFAALQARAAIGGNPLQNVQLTLGWPLDQQASSCWVDEAVTSTQEGELSRAGGASERETIDLSVRVLVRRGDLTFTAARDTALNMADEVQNALVADRTLGGSCFDSNITSTEFESGVDGENRFAGVIIRVRCWVYPTA